MDRCDSLKTILSTALGLPFLPSFSTGDVNSGIPKALIKEPEETNLFALSRSKACKIISEWLWAGHNVFLETKKEYCWEYFFSCTIKLNFEKVIFRDTFETKNFKVAPGLLGTCWENNKEEKWKSFEDTLLKEKDQTKRRSGVCLYLLDKHDSVILNGTKDPFYILAVLPPFYETLEI